MATDGTLDSNFVVLIDNWPGSPSHNLSLPEDGFTGASHHNVVAASKYKVGTKIQVYNETLGIPGFSTLIYLQFEGTATAAKEGCALDVNTSMTLVTNIRTGDLVGTGLPTCFTISAMTDAYFGWFYCGGVVPEDFVAALGGNFATAGSVAVGSAMITIDLSQDAIGFAIAASAATDLVSGYTLSTDS